MHVNEDNNLLLTRRVRLLQCTKPIPLCRYHLHVCVQCSAAAGEIPKALKDQLKPGGRMVIPVGTLFQELLVVDKLPDGQFRETQAAAVRYVPLTSKKSQLQG